MSVRSDARREQIFAAGARLFATQGYERTSLQEVADELGVTKAALYYYINSKQELLFSIMSFVMESVMKDVVEITAEKISATAKLERLVRRYIGFFTAHPNELTIMVLRQDSLSEELKGKLDDWQREYLGHVKAIVAGTLQERGARGVDVTSVTFALLGGMNWIFRWYDPTGAIPPEKLADDFFAVFGGTICKGK